MEYVPQKPAEILSEPPEDINSPLAKLAAQTGFCAHLYLYLVPQNYLEGPEGQLHLRRIAVSIWSLTSPGNLVTPGRTAAGEKLVD